MNAAADPDRERERARSIADDISGWRRWGPYLSDRSWGTVREDYCADGNAWSYLHATTRRAQGLSLGRGRHRRASAIATSCCASRPRSGTGAIRILKERLFGVTPVRGQSRRGREGVLLLPRQHADALLHERCSTSIRRRRSRTASSIEENRRRARPGPGVRAARHRHLRRRSLLRHLRSSTPRRRPRTSAIRIDASQPRPGRRAAPPPAAPVVPQHLGVGRRRRGPSRAIAPAIAAPDGSSLIADDSGVAADPNLPFAVPPRAALAVRPATAASCCSPTTRRTATRVVRAGQRRAARRTRKDAFHRCVVRRRRRRRQPRASAARRRRCTTATTCRPGGTRRAAPAAHRRQPHAIRSRDVDAIIDARKAEADEFYDERPSAEGATADEKLVQRQALAGMLWTQADLPLRRRAVARRRQPGRTRRPRRAGTSATRTGGTSTRCA